jgi:hypothetical protein
MKVDSTSAKLAMTALLLSFNPESANAMIDTNEALLRKTEQYSS